MFIFFLIFACFTVESLPPQPYIPEYFTLDVPEYGTNQTIFAAKCGDDEIANVFRIINPEKSLTYYLFTNNSILAAKAKSAPSVNEKKRIIEIFDNKNELIGSVEEVWTSKTILRKVTNLHTLLLYSKERVLIAKVGFSPAAATITIENPANKQTLAVATRQLETPIYDLQWNTSNDPRLLLLLTCLALDAPLLYKPKTP